MEPVMKRQYSNIFKGCLNVLNGFSINFGQIPVNLIIQFFMFAYNNFINYKFAMSRISVHSNVNLQH